MPATNVVPVTTYVDRDTEAVLRRLAEENDRTLASVVRVAIRYYIAEELASLETSRQDDAARGAGEHGPLRS